MYLHHLASLQINTSKAWGGGPTTDQPPAPAEGLPVIRAVLTTHPLLHKSLGTGDRGVHQDHHLTPPYVHPRLFPRL